MVPNGPQILGALLHGEQKLPRQAVMKVGVTTAIPTAEGLLSGGSVTSSSALPPSCPLLVDVALVHPVIRARAGAATGRRCSAIRGGATWHTAVQHSEVPLHSEAPLHKRHPFARFAAILCFEIFGDQSILKVLKRNEVYTLRFPGKEDIYYTLTWRLRRGVGSRGTYVPRR